MEKIVLIILLVVNMLTFITYGIDKKLAQIHSNRISENSLIFLSACFGGLGAMLGMQLFRHKTRKIKFIIIVPMLTVMQAVLLGCFFLG